MQSNQTPTADEFFGQDTKLPTSDDFFGPEQKAPEVPFGPGRVKSLSQKFTQQGPYEGPESDHLFSSNTEAARVMDAIGQGFKDGWGSAGQSIYENEIEREVRDKDTSLLKGWGSAALRPVAAALDVINHLPFAVGSAVAGGLGQTGEELKRYGQELTSEGNPLGVIPGVGGEFLGGLASGAGMEAVPEAPDHVSLLQEARSKGVVGEGEEGYFGTKPVTPEMQEARDQAAIESGKSRLAVNNKILPELPKETEPALPSIHELARQVDPDTFSKYDRLLDIQENLRLTREYLEGQLQPRGEEIPATPENRKLATGLDDVRDRLGQIDLQLRDLLPATSQARNRVQELLESDSKEGDAYRDYVQAQAFENAIRLQELRPDVTRAENHAGSLLSTGEEPTTGPEKAGEAEKGAPGGADTQNTSGGPNAAPKSSGEVSEISPDRVEAGLKETFEGSKEFEGVSYKDESQKAKALVDTNPEQAKKVALGLEPSQGIHPQAVLRAVKELAYKTGDTDLMEQLAASPLNQKASEAGQTLSLRKGIFDFDPVNLLNEVNNSFRKAAGGLKADAEASRISQTLQDRLNKFDVNWQELVRQIECPE